MSISWIRPADRRFEIVAQLVPPDEQYKILSGSTQSLIEEPQDHRTRTID
jgi:hypothetical protein